jgi:hypothetical protein
VTALGVLVVLTVAELRRLLTRLVWRPPVDPAFTLAGDTGDDAIRPRLDASTSNNAETATIGLAIGLTVPLTTGGLTGGCSCRPCIFAAR